MLSQMIWKAVIVSSLMRFITRLSPDLELNAVKCDQSKLDLSRRFFVKHSPLRLI